MSQPDMTIIVYTTESRLRRPVKLLRTMISDLVASSELALCLFLCDLKAQYRQSFLGLIWAFLPPIVMAAGFTFAKNAGVFQIGSTEIPYPAYVMLSMTLWQTFTEALNSPVKAVSSSASFLGKVNFPREAIVMAKLGEVFFNFAVKLLLIVIIFVWFKIPSTWTMVLAPFSLLFLIILGTSIGLIIAPLGALFHDLNRTLTISTSFWLFLTPVIYPVPKSGLIKTIVTLNPVTPLLVTTRELATTGVLSMPVNFFIVCAFTTALLIVSWFVYRLSLPYVIERFGG